MAFKSEKTLMAVFIIVLITRLIFAFQTPYFSDDESYYELRQIEHIKKTGLPIVNDELSYGGRTRLSTPIYSYIIAGITYIFPSIYAVKFVVNLFGSVIVFAAYLLAYQLSRNKRVSNLTALVSGFLPIYFRETVNSLNSYPFFIPAILFFIYYFINLHRKNLNKILALLFLIVLGSPSGFLLILGLILYIVFCYLEKIKLDRAEIEVIFFSLFFFLWVDFIIYKKAFTTHGIQIIWQNIPKTILDNYFITIGVFEIISVVGIIPIICGIFVIYQYLFKKKSQQVYLIVALTSSGFILFWFKLVPLILALIFLGAMLTLLSSLFFKELFIYIKKTKIANVETIVMYGLIVIVLLTMMTPSLVYAYGKIINVPGQPTIDALTWIKHNTDQNTTVLLPYTQGNLISYFAHRKNVIDSDFILITDASVRLNETRIIYTTHFKIDAIRLINKYKIDYIIFNNAVKQLYNIGTLRYATPDCFELIYNTSVQIYRPLCELDKK